MGRQKILDRKVAGIPIVQSALNLVVTYWHVRVVPKYLNFVTLSKDAIILYI